MSAVITTVTVMSIVGAGIVTGLLFAFSNIVMRALADLPPERGMFAMQRINKTIINPLFLALFLGTPLLCLIIGANALLEITRPGSVLLLSGALLYVVGPFGITMLFNVPLNNLLAEAAPSEAGEMWPMYQHKWQRWNHIRTYVGVASIALLATGLANVQP